MKIVDFKRDENNAVVAILDDDSEKVLSSEYIVQNKPQKQAVAIAYSVKRAAKPKGKK